MRVAFFTFKGIEDTLRRSALVKSGIVNNTLESSYFEETTFENTFGFELFLGTHGIEYGVESLVLGIELVLLIFVLIRESVELAVQRSDRSIKFLDFGVTLGQFGLKSGDHSSFLFVFGFETFNRFSQAGNIVIAIFLPVFSRLAIFS